MKIAIGSDHHGLEHRKTITAAIEALNMIAVDKGSFGTEASDYPDVALDVAKSVADGEVERGILVCGTGIGMAIAANKVKGIRAAVCHDEETTRLSREHNNANVLCVPGKTTTGEKLAELVTLWLETEFEGGRHARRVDKISSFETESATV